MKPYIVAMVVLVTLLLTLYPLQSQSQPALPEEIAVQQPGLMPEGVEYDAEGDRFLLGSISQGTIYAVTDDGTVSPFIEDARLTSTVGIHIDVERNRLLVTNADSAVFMGGQPDNSLSALGAYDLQTGENLFFTVLGTLVDERPLMVNDVTVDSDGNAYVTDAAAAVIYQVTPEGEARIFFDNPEVRGEGTEQFALFIGFNGIDYHPDGYLITVVTTRGLLVKIPVDQPEEFTEVETDQPVYGDGMVFLPNGSLAVVSTAFGTTPTETSSSILRLTSEDAWTSAVTAEEIDLEAVASTLAVREESVYALFPHFFEPDASQYEIRRVDLTENAGS